MIQLLFIILARCLSATERDGSEAILYACISPLLSLDPWLGGLAGNTQAQAHNASFEYREQLTLESASGLNNVLCKEGVAAWSRE